MIISCPACSAKFKIPPEKIGEGKNLTCAKCKHKWFFKLPEPKLVDNPAPSPEQIEAAIEKIVSDQAPPADDAPPMAAINHLAATAAEGHAAQEHNHYSTKKAWVLFGLLILSIVGLGSFERGLIVSHWPASARIYDLFGMPVPVLGAGLDIRDLAWELVKIETIDESTGDKIVHKPTEIEIKGNIVNHTDSPLTIPDLLAKTLDRQNKVFHQTSFKAAGEKILPKETIPFAVKLPLIENTDFRVLVTFTAPDHEMAEHSDAPATAAPAMEHKQSASAAEHSEEPAAQDHEPAAEAPATEHTETAPAEPAPASEHSEHH
ncbi:MAG: hypothetical protein EYC62_05645 [Alphaproteobacteria bacterium]|nr:MAG: hypothetical protein EYC62_05645 [Alphaproteobacteria bacterium]